VVEADGAQWSFQRQRTSHQHAREERGQPKEVDCLSSSEAPTGHQTPVWLKGIIYLELAKRALAQHLRDCRTRFVLHRTDVHHRESVCEITASCLLTVGILSPFPQLPTEARSDTPISPPKPGGGGEVGFLGAQFLYRQLHGRCNCSYASVPMNHFSQGCDEVTGHTSSWLSVGLVSPQP